MAEKQSLAFVKHVTSAQAEAAKAAATKAATKGANPSTTITGEEAGVTATSGAAGGVATKAVLGAIEEIASSHPQADEAAHTADKIPATAAKKAPTTLADIAKRAGVVGGILGGGKPSAAPAASNAADAADSAGFEQPASAIPGASRLAASTNATLQSLTQQSAGAGIVPLDVGLALDASVGLSPADSEKQHEEQSRNAAAAKRTIAGTGDMVKGAQGKVFPLSEVMQRLQARMHQHVQELAAKGRDSSAAVEKALQGELGRLASEMGIDYTALTTQIPAGQLKELEEGIEEDVKREKAEDQAMDNAIHNLSLEATDERAAQEAGIYTAKAAAQDTGETHAEKPEHHKEEHQELEEELEEQVAEEHHHDEHAHLHAHHEEEHAIAETHVAPAPEKHVVTAEEKAAVRATEKAERAKVAKEEGMKNQPQVHEAREARRAEAEKAADELDLSASNDMLFGHDDTWDFAEGEEDSPTSATRQAGAARTESEEKEASVDGLKTKEDEKSIEEKQKERHAAMLRELAEKQRTKTPEVQKEQQEMKSASQVQELDDQAHKPVDVHGVGTEMEDMMKDHPELREQARAASKDWPPRGSHVDEAKPDDATHPSASPDNHVKDHGRGATPAA